jgi:hypothetical protein
MHNVPPPITTIKTILIAFLKKKTETIQKFVRNHKKYPKPSWEKKSKARGLTSKYTTNIIIKMSWKCHKATEAEWSIAVKPHICVGLDFYIFYRGAENM